MQLTNDQKNILRGKIVEIFERLAKNTEFGKRFDPVIRSGDYMGFADVYTSEIFCGWLAQSYSLLELITHAKDLIEDKLRLLDPVKDSRLAAEAKDALDSIDQVNAAFLALDADLHKQDISRREQETLIILKELAATQKKLASDVKQLRDNQDKMSEKIALLLEGESSVSTRLRAIDLEVSLISKTLADAINNEVTDSKERKGPRKFLS